MYVSARVCEILPVHIELEHLGNRSLRTACEISFGSWRKQQQLGPLCNRVQRQKDAKIQNMTDEVARANAQEAAMAQSLASANTLLKVGLLLLQADKMQRPAY